jgi:hypothetical protein
MQLKPAEMNGQKFLVLGQILISILGTGFSVLGNERKGKLKIWHRIVA